MACFGLTALLISQLDLNDYLPAIETRLSASLRQPVAIAEIHLAFEKGLAIELKQLVVGDPAAPLAEVPRLTATLKLRPLLERKLVFTQALIERPNLQFFLPLEKTPARESSQQLIDSFGINILTVRDAQLKIIRPQPDSPGELLHLNNLHAVLTGWGKDKSGRLVITGDYRQREHFSDFTVDLNLPAKNGPDEWRNEKMQVQLTLKQLASDALPAPFRARAPQFVDLHASLDGVPAEGASVQARLLSHQEQEELLSLNSLWLSTSHQESLKKLTGELLGLPIEGKILLDREPEQTLLSGTIGTQNQALSPELLRRWRIPKADKLQEGDLDRLILDLKKSWPVTADTKEQRRLGLEFAVTNLEWASPELQQLQDFSAELLLDDQNLMVSDGLASVGGHPIQFSGQIETLFKQPQLDLNLLFEPDLKRLEEQLTLPEHWQLSGPIPVTLKLTGRLDEPNYALHAELAATSIQLGELLQKTPEQQGSLQLNGLIDKEHLQVDDFEMTLGDFLIRGEGNFPRQPATDSVLLNLDGIDLAKLRAFSPLLEKLQLTGQIRPSLEYSKATGVLGHLQVSGLGTHFFHIVGDLNQARGEIHFNRDGLHFEELSAALGESPITLSGELTSWQEPRLELRVQSPEIRAIDLIFRNPELIFYDLDGRLLIDKQGIAFAPVHVTLETETQATVRGQVKDFKDPEVVLDISAEKANILDVIKVFQGPSRKPKQKEPAPKREFKPLLINVSARQGTLDGLSFQNAEGQIRDHRGVFTIYPLSFENDDGYCVARVEFDRNRQPGVLKVSGHAEDIDASVLHQSIFAKRGLISGELRGDFYLEGATAAGRFWHNATGGIHLQVRNGTLRKFRGLARVFSLLNVSQILAGKAPDMDKEGMPFTLLEGSVRIADGRLRTDDLHVESVAMNLSLVGERNLIEDTVNFDLGVMPLRTVDKVVSNIPIAGWVLAGEDKALFTAHFKIKGPSDAPKVRPIPIDSVSNTVFGIVKRTFGLPGKLVKDLGEILNRPANPELSPEQTESPGED